MRAKLTPTACLVDSWAFDVENKTCACVHVNGSTRIVAGVLEEVVEKQST